MKILVPVSPDNLGGEAVLADTDFEVLADREKVVLIEFIDVPPGITWFDSFELLYCQRQHDPQTIKVVRKATDQERRTYRVPLWIQGEDVPECCGHPMFFVGQIDDDTICSEPPADAELWWHDVASFYVFTCPKCLSVKAVGQQY